ncbi:MAG: DUF4367 domain-containing protein [Lachnospiraceae bacterium]|jgi:hypothetical protein|nr:DUF4367 domain-containing protein [Lachnospiraceae bacterium]
MKMDDNQKKNNNKITPFPSQEERETDKEFDALFKERLLSDADAYEKELNENPDLADVKAPDDLFERIVGELKEKNIWEEDEEAINADTEWMNKRVELTKDEIYNLLSDDDRAALELGLKVQGRKKWKRVVKYGGTVAAIFIGMFLISMSSDANRIYFTGIINAVFGSSLKTDIGSNDKTLESNWGEKEAYQEILEKLNLKAPQLMYYPPGFKYHGYQINEEMKSATIYYDYKDTIATVYIRDSSDRRVRNQTFDGEIIDKITINISDTEVELWESKNSDEKNAYLTQFVHENTYYAIWGKIDKLEFSKMIENINL